MAFLPPLIIGEVLFDHFPAGTRVLGGAPFNVAWNLQGFGLSPLFLSAVGADDEGREIRERMRAWGLSDRALGVAANPTGKVQVEVENGQPSFEILDHQAYDQIQYPKFPISPAEFSLLYVGSLAFRHEPSRLTIKRLISESGLRRFVDINVRPPWFERAWLPELLQGASWIKMNQAELAQLADSECNTPEAIRAASARLRSEFSTGGQRHYITCGGDGAYVVDEENQLYFAQAPAPEPLVDTVGAGDAFASTAIVGIVTRDPIEDTLQSAVRFASRACSIQGATTENSDYYNLTPS